jgi:membrane-associated phospholipid phosphatase
MKATVRCTVILINVLFLGSVKSYGQNWDIDILKSINPRYPTSEYWRSTSASAFYFSGVASIGTLIYGFANNNNQVRLNAYEEFVSVGLSTIASEGLKIGINRERPSNRYPNEVFVSSPTRGGSFPSGHTTLAFNTATTISLEYRKWYVTLPAYVWAGSVGYSRLYLGKHYPSDVLAGSTLGIGTGYISHWLTKQLFKPYVKHIPK